MDEALKKEFQKMVKTMCRQQLVIKQEQLM